MDQWLEKEWGKLLLAEGANLQLPGNKVIAERLLDEGKRAVWVLIEHLHVAKVTKTMADVQTADLPFVGGRMYGFIDLLVEKASGEKAIIDLKYGGHPSRRGRSSLITCIFSWRFTPAWSLKVLLGRRPLF